MEIKILEDSKTKLVFELPGESHTFCNALREELWEDKNVDAAAYNIKHPLISAPKFLIEAKDPKKALKEAAKRLDKKSDEFLKAFKKAK
ncbi:DNA-directed RNA polymerase subunit L [Candidatus Woesearchaeota archaeon]|nr:MAG: DNA-directed RNA polymerase subunit L [Candidatus Woesearchaeota archaeon]